MADTIITETKGFRAWWKVVPASAKAGFVLTILAFVAPVTVERERFVSGEAICEFFDFGAWIFGLITIVLGLVTLVEARRSDRRTMVLVLGVVVTALGVFNVLRAYGVFFSPC